MPETSKSMGDKTVFLHGLLFDPEDGSNIFLPNFELSPKYTTLQQENHTVHSHSRDNLNPINVTISETSLCAWPLDGGRYLRYHYKVTRFYFQHRRGQKSHTGDLVEHREIFFRNVGYSRYGVGLDKI
jgi:hypothetical protein